jgi:hypothetical protein
MNNSRNNLIIILIKGLLLTSNVSLAQTYDIQSDEQSTDMSNVELSNSRNNSAPVNNAITSTAEQKQDQLEINETNNNVDVVSTDNELAESESALIDSECLRIGAKLGSVSYNDCLKLNLRLTGSNSVNNASLLFKEYPPVHSFL